MLCSTLGYSLFDKLEVSKSKGNDLLYIKQVGVIAIGKYTDEGIVIFKGSEARVKEAPSLQKSIVTLRRQLLLDGIIEQEGTKYIFREDYSAGSPSKASSLIIGNHTNGWNNWKNKTGKTLNELKRM